MFFKCLMEGFMSFSKELEKMKAPTIYKLVLDGQIKGLRVKVCKTSRGRGIPTICYYDFLIKYVLDKEIQDFLKNNINSFETKTLIMKDNVCMTQDEIEGKVDVQEFASSEDALKVLKVAYNYYNKNKEM